MSIRVEIDPGICKFRAVVLARTGDNQNVDFEFETECEIIREFARRIGEISPVDAIATLSPEENPILKEARELLQDKGCCDACVVPAGTVKGMQVAAGLALPKEVSLSIERTGEID